MFVIACFLVFVCLEFQIIRLVIITFTPIVFIEISFVLLPPPPGKLLSQQVCLTKGLLAVKEPKDKKKTVPVTLSEVHVGL